VSRYLRVGAVLVWLGALPLRAQPSRQTLRDFLATNARLTSAQVGAVARGEVVVRALPSGDERDVGVVGVVRIDRPRSALIDEMRASGFASGFLARAAVHLFDTPAKPGDVEAVRLTRDDVDELRRCQPNACNFKLPAADMAALRAAVAGNRTNEATAYMRRRMLEYVTAYRQRGNAAMLVYDDLGSVQASDAFEAMLRDSSDIFTAAPSLGHFLLAYPRDSLHGAKNAVYWSVDAMPRVRPTLRIMHEVVYTPLDVAGTTVIAAKQLYANHYFEAGLEVTVAVDDSIADLGGSRRGTVVMALRRYRFDQLRSGGPIDIRGRVAGGLRDALANDLRRLGRGGGATK